MTGRETGKYCYMGCDVRGGREGPTVQGVTTEGDREVQILKANIDGQKKRERKEGGGGEKRGSKTAPKRKRKSSTR